MMTYSLLQVSLEQTIERVALEAASVAAPSVARADCAALHRDLYGILISGLPLDEAKAFQAELRHHGFLTDVLADNQVPVLHERYQVQRIDQRGEMLMFTDAMGRQQVRMVKDLVFMAGGLMKDLKLKSESSQHLDLGRGQHQGMPRLVTTRKFYKKDELEFRMDFFFIRHLIESNCC